jgi:hypothetical protein
MNKTIVDSVPPLHYGLGEPGRGGGYLQDNPTLESVYSWSERFERVRIDYPTLLHEKSIYSHHRRAKDINVLANLASSTLLAVGITTELLIIPMSAIRTCYWGETHDLGLSSTSSWAQTQPKTIWFLFALRRVELYACIHSQGTYIYSYPI